MRSELIEFFRFNSTETGILRPGDPYLLVRGDEPARQVEVPIRHVDFLRKLDRLRYGSRTSEDERQAALSELSGAVLGMLGSVPRPEGALQLDLVANAAELSALPFELATDADGTPVFADPRTPLVLTRRIRRGSHGERPAWWSKPRVLFAVASPAGAGAPAPREAHLEALRVALKPWIEPLKDFPEAVPDESSVLEVVPKASLEAILRAGQKAIDDGKPFTHLHVLAHGCAIGDRYEQHFGLAMHDDENDSQLARVTPEELCAKLEPLAKHLVVVTLAACDGGNEADSIAGGGSMAHHLHSSGIPVVVASQFPMTFDGSVIFTRAFYENMLGGNDIRAALHTTRSDLYRQLARIGHDWASLVAYVQLPEDYIDRQVEVGLQAELASLKTAQLWSDHLVQHKVRDPAKFEEVARVLKARIAVLDKFQKDHAKRMKAADRDENLGLLGSTEKRLAELYFHRAALGDDTDGWQSQSRQALRESRDWYENTFARNLSHHWSGVQALALEAVLTGGISRKGRWYAAREAAETDNGNPKEKWASGTLAELYLLATLAGLDSQLDEAGHMLRDLVARARTSGDSFPIESTERQLKRYTNWWTKENGYFGDAPDLAREAEQLLDVLALSQRD
jgi:CHAT domain